MNRLKAITCGFGSVLMLWGFAVPLRSSSHPSSPPLRVPSDVAWTRDTIKLASGGDAFRGMLVARRCGHCHGAEGFSAQPFIANLAGIDRLSIWKQLQDFRSGKRISPVMQAMVLPLSARDLADISAYFSMLPTFADPQDNRSFPQTVTDPGRLRAAQRLVAFGDGRRGIPPCQACHGPVGHVKGASALGTQNGRYVLAQLQHFADGTRANDINMVMRTSARQLTSAEQEALAEYYGGGLAVNPPEGDPVP